MLALVGVLAVVAAWLAPSSEGRASGPRPVPLDGVLASVRNADVEAVPDGSAWLSLVGRRRRGSPLTIAVQRVAPEGRRRAAPRLRAEPDVNWPVSLAVYRNAPCLGFMTDGRPQVRCLRGRFWRRLSSPGFRRPGLVQIRAVGGRLYGLLVSGSLRRRYQLVRCLGRSLRHLIDTVTGLADRGVGFRSLQESIDTTTPGGRLIFHVFAALAEFERDLIAERTQAWLAAARARGRKGGRPPVMTPDKLAVAREMYASGEHTVAAIAAVLGVSRASVYRHLA